jgi:hypothetical protein
MKKEFSYIEVPKGQGLYAWSDYNGNGIKELDEFDIAAFADQADYIRVFIPTSEFVRAYTSKFSELIQLEPSRAWRGKKGIRGLLARFSLQAGYSIENKNTATAFLEAYNPFRFSENDQVLLTRNSSYRNTLWFNKSASAAGLEFGMRGNRSKMLLVSGFDSRGLDVLYVRVRWNISRVYGLLLTGEYGEKTSRSEFFPGRGYNIFFHTAEPRLNIQPSTSYRLSLYFKYTDKYNTGGEQLYMNNAGVESRLNFLSKGSLNARINYISIRYNAGQNSPLAYEMLEGLKSGNNATWSLGYQRNLSQNLQLGINYEGRDSPGTPAVHTGSMQLRAYF